MPRIPSKIDREMEACLAQWAEFEDSTAWRKSGRGNLCRNWDGRLLTIFQRKGKSDFSWCIADDETGEQQYARKSYETVADAMSALGEFLGVGM